MAAHAGRAINFEWKAGEIAGVRQKSIAINGEPIDITSDENNGWRTLLLDAPAQQQVDISVSGVTKSSVLKRDWFQGLRDGECRFEYPDGSVISGTFLLISYTDTGAYNDATTFEATFQSSGPVVFIPYS